METNPAPTGAPAPDNPRADARHAGRVYLIAGLILTLLTSLALYLQRDSRSVLVPYAATIGWIAIGYGLATLVWGGRRSALGPVMRLVLAVAFGFGGSFFTFGILVKKERPPLPPPAMTHSRELTQGLEAANALADARPVYPTHKVTLRHPGLSETQCAEQAQQALAGLAELMGFEKMGQDLVLSIRASGAFDAAAFASRLRGITVVGTEPLKAP